jgi:hypothetical protein
MKWPLGLTGLNHLNDNEQRQTFHEQSRLVVLMHGTDNRSCLLRVTPGMPVTLTAPPVCSDNLTRQTAVWVTPLLDIELFNSYQPNVRHRRLGLWTPPPPRDAEVKMLCKCVTFNANRTVRRNAAKCRLSEDTFWNRKFFLDHSMKAHKARGSLTPPILNFDTGRRWMVISCPEHLSPENNPGNDCIGGGTRWHSWLRHCATCRKVAGSIPDAGHWNFLVI